MLIFYLLIFEECLVCYLYEICDLSVYLSKIMFFSNLNGVLSSDPDGGSKYRARIIQECGTRMKQ